MSRHNKHVNVDGDITEMKHLRMQVLDNVALSSSDNGGSHGEEGSNSEGEEGRLGEAYDIKATAKKENGGKDIIPAATDSTTRVDIEKDIVKNEKKEAELSSSIVPKEKKCSSEDFGGDAGDNDGGRSNAVGEGGIDPIALRRQQIQQIMQTPGAFQIFPNRQSAAAIDDDEDADTREEQQQDVEAPPTPLDAHVYSDEIDESLVQQRIRERTVAASTVRPIVSKDNDQNEPSSRQKEPGNDRVCGRDKNALIIFLTGVTIILAGTVVILAVALSRTTSNVNDGDDATKGVGDTGDALENFKQVLLSLYDEDEYVQYSSPFDDVATPQYRALQWLVHEDPIRNYTLVVLDGVDGADEQTTVHMAVNFTFEMLIERYAATVVYFSLGGQSWYHPLGFLSNKTTCDWNFADALGLKCGEDDGLVHSLELGMFPTVFFRSYIAKFSPIGTLSLRPHS